MTSIAHIAAPPPGWRYLTAHEGECMNYSDLIVLWDGRDKHHGIVYGHNDEKLICTLRSGAIVRLDLDHPDFWPASRTGDRNPPSDGELVAIRETGATADADVEPLLRVSVAVSQMMKDDPELAAAVRRVREILAARIRGVAA